MRRLKYTALHRAILDCRAAQVRLLIEQCGADVNSRDLYGRTPLMLCCALDNQRVAMAMAKLVLTADPDLSVKDELGRTVLAHACLFGREVLVTRLADCGVIDPTEPDNDGCTPLHHAAVQGNSRIVSLLVRACVEGRSNVDCQNLLGCTPLMLACRLRRYHSALFLLLDGGASGFLKDNAHFLGALEWLRRAEGQTAADHLLGEPQPLRRAETAPQASFQASLRAASSAQPPTFLTEYSSLGRDGGVGGGRPRGLARARTIAGVELRQRSLPLPLPLDPPPGGFGGGGSSGPTSRPTTGGSGQRSRYTSATGDTVYVNVDVLSAREARNLLVERLRAQALDFPYPKAAAASAPVARARPTTRDLQSLRPPPRSSAVVNACQLLGLYHAAMTAPKPAQVMQREETGISDTTVGGGGGGSASEAGTAPPAVPGEKSGSDAAHQGHRTSQMSASAAAAAASAAANEAAAKDKKSVKFKDVSK